MALSDNAKGAALMSASMAGFVLNDTFMKLVGPEVGLAQSIFVRGLMATLLVGAFAAWAGALRVRIERPDLRLIGMRTLAEIAATFAFITALFHMPLANLTAILQVLPLTITLAAALFLGEPVGPRRLLAIVVGFVGVLLIVRPGFDGFNGYALLGLLAVACVTVRDLSARRLSVRVPSLFVAFVTAAVVTAVAGLLLVIEGQWTPLTPEQFFAFARAALCILVGYWCSVGAMRVGEVAVVSGYRYTILLWAIALGWWFFGEAPDLLSVLGMSLILGAGLFTMWREARLSRRARLAAATAPTRPH